VRKKEYNIDIIYCIMSENISVTRIVDLPDTFSQETNGLSSDMYIPMNVHPNPYGMPPPPPGGIAPPQQTQTGPTQYANTMYSSNVNMMDGQGQGLGQGQGQGQDLYAGVNQRLPQRDVPINISEHTQDEEIKPNYIPKPKVTADYIDEYQETAERKNKEYEEKKKKEQIAENWFDELHIPVLVALLYFVFQMPIVNTLIFKRFSFLAIYKEDGNFNLTGLTLKCILFGFLFYSLSKIVQIVGNL